MNIWKPCLGMLLGAVVAMPGNAAEKDDGILNKIFGNETAEVVTQDRVNMSLSVKDFIGRNIINAEGERLGKVVDLTITDATGRFDRAIVSVGGFLSLGDVLIAVPYNKIRHQDGTKDLVWRVSMEEFNGMIAQAKAKSKESAGDAETVSSPGGRRQAPVGTRATPDLDSDTSTRGGSDTRSQNGEVPAARR